VDGWYPGGAPDVRLRRLTGGGQVWTSECIVRHTDGTVAHGVDVIELRDNKIWKETRYFGAPFDPPAWRAALGGGAAASHVVRRTSKLRGSRRRRRAGREP
jgi:hypothetical protein